LSSIIVFQISKQKIDYNQYYNQYYVCAFKLFASYLKSLHFQTKQYKASQSKTSKQAHNPQCEKSLKEQNQYNITRENISIGRIEVINLSLITPLQVVYD